MRSFYSTLPIVKMPKGSIIFQQSDVPTKGYIVKKGIVKICNFSSMGAEKIISFKIIDELLPVGWIFSKATTAMFYYQTHTNCELYEISRENLKDQTLKSQEFADSLFDTLAGVYVDSSLRVDALLQMRARAKLLYAFRHLCLYYGRVMLDHRIRIQIPLTQQDLANYTGLTRETTTLELNKLKAGGIINYRRKYYSIDTKKLDNLLDDDYNPGVKNRHRSTMSSL